MPTFAVDEDLVAFVWEQAKPAPFEQLSFSEALRRVLKDKPQQHLSKQPLAESKINVAIPNAEELFAELEALPSNSGEQRGRAPKADLRELVKLGFLKEGQELIFVDYKGQMQPKYKAAISDGRLKVQKVRYSMSALSSILLKKEGYIAESVRGPDHWATADGKRIRQLWEDILKQRGAR